MYKKLILGTALGLVIFASDSLAETTGSCGTNCTYTMDDAGHVVVTGSGTLGTLQGVDRKQITSVIIPDGITSISYDVFNGSQLTSINIPSSVQSIGSRAFKDTKLTSVIIPDGITSIASETFLNVPLTSVTIPDSVTSIDRRAFTGTQLTSVTIPDSVTSIGEQAFSGTQLTSITIPDSVVSIGNTAFYGSPLTSAEIQGKNVYVGDYAFYNIPTKVVQYAGDITWSCGADCTATLGQNGHVEITGSGALTMSHVTTAGFQNRIKSITIPDGVTSIGNNAFSGTALETVIIPDSVTSIGVSAFRGTQLTSVTIPDSVTSIGEWAFHGNKLTSVTIPDSVTSIGNYAFYGNALTTLILPDSVASIGESAFGYNPSLTEIFCPKASVESGRCASMASAGNANVSKINFGYYKDDAMNDERVFYLKDENGVWKEDHRESIYEKYIVDTGAVYLYDSKGNLKKMRGKQIYTIEEAVEATKNGNSFHVGLTYK